eukprot:CAMPEP_0114567618 /NCGR_PEP_ID=MMETSP0114-20121206/15580_1 /TAXON_ID=31324 /ORGANISM="Goniomonas sp, Strain m" /LENGTH=353 /DNA_ID=CAMNT_0001754225 /DNA_START=256 /DNA_END=1317 /DNA_ORIENTATION=+
MGGGWGAGANTGFGGNNNRQNNRAGGRKPAGFTCHKDRGKSCEEVVGLLLADPRFPPSLQSAQGLCWPATCFAHEDGSAPGVECELPGDLSPEELRLQFLRMCKQAQVELVAGKINEEVQHCNKVRQEFRNSFKQRQGNRGKEVSEATHKGCLFTEIAGVAPAAMGMGFGGTAGFGASSNLGFGATATPGGFGSPPPPATVGFGTPGGFGTLTPPATGGFGALTPAAPGGFGSLTPAAPGGFGAVGQAAPGGFGSATPSTGFGTLTPPPAPSGFGSITPPPAVSFGSAANGGIAGTTNPAPGTGASTPTSQAVTPIDPNVLEQFTAADKTAYQSQEFGAAVPLLPLPACSDMS